MTIFASRLRSYFSESKFAGTLQTYFRSGWAFLIPYLVAYLLYAWLRWPVNPVASGQWTVIPCLLHVYWLFHAVHLVLGAIALRTWWRESGATVTGATVDSANAPNGAAQPQPSTVPHSGNRSPSTVHRLQSTVYRLLPWLCLGLLFWIPGLYLEFPADSLAHMGRIIEWSQANQVGENHSWLKASYFLAFSITALGDQVSFEPYLASYYSGICLLLCWQNYRLALAMKLGSAGSFFFAALQLLVFGNSAFSYHRYYGLSSTIVAQLTTVALLRIVLTRFTSPRSAQSLGGAALAVGCLMILVFFSHVQGLLISAISVIALGLWWLSRHHQIALTTLFALAAAATLTLIAKAIFAPSAVLISLQDAGWLNSVGAFNLFEEASPAQHRVLELIGTFGVASGLLALFMFRRNHPGAWLMTVPWALLMVPITAYPLALYLYGAVPEFMLRFHGRGLDYFSVFSRQLFAMPLALPFAWLFAESLAHPRWARLAPVIPLGIIWVLLALPPAAYNHARLWQALARTPADLNLRIIHEAIVPVRAMTMQGGEKNIIGSYGTSFVLGELGAKTVPLARRLIQHPGIVSPAKNQEEAQTFFASYGPIREFIIVLPSHGMFFSPGSQTALLSRHWLPQEAALNLAGAPEMATSGRKAGFREHRFHPQLVLLTTPPP